MTQRVFTFSGGTNGPWVVQQQTAIIGQPLPPAARLAFYEGATGEPSDPAWRLTGVVSNERYVERAEKRVLGAESAGLGRPQASLGALIPIRKSAAWWALAQDERREIFEVQSRHIAIGLNYLPAIARRLHHCRDLAAPEPFDFLTWFEYAPADAAAFDELVAALRASPEWAYVEREVDVRVVREAG